MASRSLITETVPLELLEEQDVIVVALDQMGQTKYEKAIKLKNPFAFDTEGFCPSDSMSLEGFFTLTNDIIADAQAREQAVERVIFTDEYPSENMEALGKEVITYRVISRKPGNMSTDAKSRQQIGFGYSYHLRDPRYPDKVIIKENRPVDHIIEFTCWSKRARIANQRALWLERTLINQTWAYQSRGVDRFVWEDRLADTFYNVGGQTLFQRPLRFFVRLHEYRTRLEPVISGITYVSSTL